MADVARSKADILVLFADNSIGAISEQDLRDFVVSLLGGFASILVKSGVASQAVTATPIKMTGFTANGLAVGVTADYANNEMVADVDGVYRVQWDICFSGTLSSTFHVGLYKDTGGGYADLNEPDIERKLGTGGDVGASGMHTDVALNAGDKLALYVWSSDGGTSFVPQEAKFSMKRIG